MKGIASSMVKTVVIRKRNIIMHGIIILVLAVASIVLRTYLTDNSRNQDYITYVQALYGVCQHKWIHERCKS